MEKFMNRLTDMDSGWYPFLFLKPKQNQLMNTKYVFKMSLYYGPFFGLLMYIGIWAIDKEFIITHLLIAVAYVTTAFFIGYRITFAYFWNKRAKRLQSNAS